MKRVVLIRHGKAAMAGKDHERELDEDGIVQADSLKKKLLSLGLKPSKIYTSPFKRAVQTIKPFSDTSDKIVIEEKKELEEIHIPKHFKMDKIVEEEELQVTDWEILMGFVASGVEPRGIKLVDDFYQKYKKIFDEEMKTKGYFQIIKRSPLYICKKIN